MHNKTRAKPPQPLPEDVVLSVRNVSKKFCRNLRRSMAYGIKDLALNMVGVRQKTDSMRKDEFWALRDINFDIRRGEVLGLIGPNGCGKTTLLRIINGIFPPDKGEVCVRGRTGALISLGAGFHGHLTGRENVYLNGTIIGLSRRDIAERLDAIIDFAGIGEFIDAPVVTYSSGMRVKLGFAIAINVQCDLLLIDEVLAVGDIGFKIKCMNAIRAILDNTAVVFVSHSMQFISSFTTRVLVMDHGKIVDNTPNVGDGIDHYLSLFPTQEVVAGTGDAQISNIQLHALGKMFGNDEEVVIPQHSELAVTFDLKVLEPACRQVSVVMTIKDMGMDPVIAMQPQGTGVYPVNAQNNRVRINCGAIHLNAGKYSVAIAVKNVPNDVCLARIEGVGKFRVHADRLHWARTVQAAEISLAGF